MNEVELYILEQDGPQREIMQYLDDLLLSYPEITAKMRFSIPFYYRKSWVCYLNPTKDGRVELAFTWGRELSNEQGLLEARGRKLVRGVTFASIEEIPEETLHEILQEAFLVDEEVAARRKPKKKK